MVSSIISLWSVSNSKLDWVEVRLLTSGVLWQMGGGRLLFVVVGLLVMLHLLLGSGGCLMGAGLTPH